MAIETAPAPEPEMLTVKQAAAWLQLHENAVYRMVEDGKIPSLRVGGAIRIPRSKLLEMISTAPETVQQEVKS